MAETMQPTWSSDAALDAAFANWIPGQLEDVEVDHCEVVASDDPPPVDAVPNQLDELLGQLATVEPDPLAVPHGLWTRADDDILPPRRRGLRRRR